MTSTPRRFHDLRIEVRGPLKCRVLSWVELDAQREYLPEDVGWALLICCVSTRISGGGSSRRLCPLSSCGRRLEGPRPGRIEKLDGPPQGPLRTTPRPLDRVRHKYLWLTPIPRASLVQPPVPPTDTVSIPARTFRGKILERWFARSTFVLF